MTILEKSLLSEVILSKRTYNNAKKLSIGELESKGYISLAEDVHRLTYLLYFYYLKTNKVKN